MPAFAPVDKPCFPGIAYLGKPIDVWGGLLVVVAWLLDRIEVEVRRVAADVDCAAIVDGAAGVGGAADVDGAAEVSGAAGVDVWACAGMAGAGADACPTPDEESSTCRMENLPDRATSLWEDFDASTKTTRYWELCQR